MELIPILAALRRNKIGALLIGMQIALTLGIVCNSLSIIQQYVQRMQRPSGTDEANIFAFENEWVGHPTDLKSRIEEDLSALRALPNVVDAVATNSYPLRGGGWSTDMYRTPDTQLANAVHTAIYLADEHGLQALGVRLVAGRWFRADEISDLGPDDLKEPSSIVVTRALAKVLAPSGDVLGRNVYLWNKQPSRIIGIVERTQTPWASGSWAEPFVENSTFEPFQVVNNGLYYVVRTRPGAQASVMREAEQKLYEITPARVIQNIQPLAAARAAIYRGDHAATLILGAVCGLLLAVTAFGVVGLTMYWVTQRRRQIGVRRALGARRLDILRYFHTENFLITGAASLVGIGVGLYANAWLASMLELTRMSVGYICLAAVLVIALSQAAVFWPALRAASISPASAARGL